MKKNTIQGFTLFEITVALVIIGLIIGGVYVGINLVKAAEVRSSATRLEQFDAAVAAFRTKYRYFPGDLPYSRALGYGLPAGNNATEGGDGDGLISDKNINEIIGSIILKWYAEIPLVWPQLHYEGLIGGDGYNGQMEEGFGYPSLPVGGGVILNGDISVADANGHRMNYFLVGKFLHYEATNDFSFLPYFSAETAYALDLKRDDGKPFLGTTIVAPVMIGGINCHNNGICVLIEIFVRILGTTMFFNPEFTMLDALFPILDGEMEKVGIDLQSSSDIILRSCVSNNSATEEKAGQGEWLVGNDLSLCSMVIRMDGN